MDEADAYKVVPRRNRGFLRLKTIKEIKAGNKEMAGLRMGAPFRSSHVY
jgi:hypothetical protein